jgi:large subunit ribosomal protein L31
MKANIHPTYFPQAQVSCVCGNTFVTGSTKNGIKVEICQKCHPFYTGTQKFVDTVGNIEKFRSKIKVATAKQAVASDKKKKIQEDERRPKTLREMLQGAK